MNNDTGTGTTKRRRRMTQKEKREYVESILEEPHSLDPRTVEVLEEYLSTLDRQWVSVSERLPKHGKNVLVYCDNPIIGSGKIVHIGSCEKLNGVPCWFLSTRAGFSSYPNQAWNITHWMDLPKPPSTEGVE